MALLRADAPHNALGYLPELACLIGMCTALSGCASLAPPQRLYEIPTESNDIRTEINADTLALRALINAGKRKEARHKRNEIIAARKYAIDMQYTKYEAELTREGQLSDFATRAANIALGTTAGLVPVVHTKNLLNGLALGVTSLDSAYNEKVLREKLIESIQSSMRAARHERAAIIYANMRCSVKTYPVAMALSDLEAYYRAGTFAAGLIKLSNTVTKEEGNAAATADAQKAGNTDAQAKLAGMAVEAQVKATNAMAPAGAMVTFTPSGIAVTQTGKKGKGEHKCSPKDELE